MRMNHHPMLNQQLIQNTVTSCPLQLPNTNWAMMTVHKARLVPQCHTTAVKYSRHTVTNLTRPHPSRSTKVRPEPQDRAVGTQCDVGSNCAARVQDTNLFTGCIVLKHMGLFVDATVWFGHAGDNRRAHTIGDEGQTRRLVRLERSMTATCAAYVNNRSVATASQCACDRQDHHISSSSVQALCHYRCATLAAHTYMPRIVQLPCGVKAPAWTA